MPPIEDHSARSTKKIKLFAIGLGVAVVLGVFAFLNSPENRAKVFGKAEPTASPSSTPDPACQQLILVVNVKEVKKFENGITEFIGIVGMSAQDQSVVGKEFSMNYQGELKAGQTVRQCINTLISLP